MEISQKKFKNWSDNNDPKLKENCMDNKIEKKTPLNLEKKKLNPDKFVRYWINILKHSELLMMTFTSKR